MRNTISTIIAALIFATVSVVYSQYNSARTNMQLVNEWELSGQKGAKDGMVEGNAVLVFDGDTIGIVTKNGSRYTIRLRGIDAPENRQPFGRESSDELAYLVQGMDVVAVVGEPDSNDRYVGAVFIDGQDVSLAQVRKGMAWTTTKNAPALSKEQKDLLQRAENSARTERIGLWATPDPIAPWIFRGEGVDKSATVKESNNASASTSKTLPPVASSSAAKPETTKPPATSISRKYILGPRGGCYYLNAQGVKVYVRNKELCTKQ